MISVRSTTGKDVCNGRHDGDKQLIFNGIDSEVWAKR
jgi:hypothetical protein